MTGQNLELKTGLHLRLTQKMQQAIKLLQMSNQELSEFVATIVESNPLLDYQEEIGGHDTDDFDFEPEFGNPLDIDATNPDFEGRDEVLDHRYENVWQDECYEFSSSSSKSLSGDNDYDPFYNIQQQEGLRAYLLNQIKILFQGEHYFIAQAFADLVDDAGYLPSDYEESLLEKGFSQADVDHVLEILQTLEPAGIFARTLEECLLLQLKDREEYTEEIEQFLHVLKTHNGSPDALAEKMGISKEACLHYLSLLKTLNPKPGLCIGEISVAQVVPDILMRRSSGDWVIELNQANLPKVYLNSAYFIELKNIMKKVDDKSYLSEKFAEGKWLLKSLHQRAVNILKVADVVVRHQASFFKNTEGNLKPLTLKDVALETELSESTVSRVTTDKYIETPRGIFELKSFFSTQVGGYGCEDQSAHGIQQAIRKLIAVEDTQAPLSDGEIVGRLKIMGIAVARRTVVKYRDILKIDNAMERKKFYAWKSTDVQKDGKILAFGS